MLLNQEPYNECVATDLHGRILEEGDFVPYHLRLRGSDVVSACPNFVGPTEEFVAAYYVKGVLRKLPHRNDYRHYIECCEALGANGAERALQKMIVCGDIVANTDRHWRNFGLVRDVETLKYRVAPLFDSGTSLWCRLPTRDMVYAGFGFNTKPFEEEANDQLRLVDDFSWLDFDALEGFPEAATDMLEENPALAGRVDFVFEGIRSRIDHLRAMAS